MYRLSFKPEFSSSKNLLPLFFMVFLEVWLHPKLEKTLKVSRGKISFLRSFSRNAILRLFRNHSVLVLNLKHTQSLSYFVSFFSQALKRYFMQENLRVLIFRGFENWVCTGWPEKGAFSMLIISRFKLYPLHLVNFDR